MSDWFRTHAVPQSDALGFGRPPRTVEDGLRVSEANIDCQNAKQFAAARNQMAKKHTLADLAQVIAAWPDPPDHIRQTIQTTTKTAGRQESSKTTT